MIKPLSIDKFGVSKDEDSRKLLSDWAWFDVLPPDFSKNWTADRTWLREKLGKLVDNLVLSGQTAWLSVYGPFLPEGVIGILNALVSSDDCARFCLPEVRKLSSSTGPGYVYGGFSIEYREGYFDRIEQEASRSLGGTGTYFAVICLASKVWQEAIEYPIFSDDLYRDNLTVEMQTILRVGSYIFLPIHDFDVMTVGCKHELEQDFLPILTRLMES